MQLITYYNFVRHKEIEVRGHYSLTDQELLYRNFINYAFLAIYAKERNKHEIDLYFVLVNNATYELPFSLKAYNSGGYYCIGDISPLPSILLDRIQKNGAGLKGMKHYYLHRVLVAISLDITSLEIHHVDRNSLNDRIDNLLPVTKEEHDLIHELESDNEEITYSPQIAKVDSITTYTKNCIAQNMQEGRLNAQTVTEITGKPLKEVNSWLADYKKYGRVGSKSHRPVNNVFKLPDFYIIKMLKSYYIDRLTIEQTREELLKSRLLNPKTKKPVTIETIQKYIDGHPYFTEWYNLYKND